MRRTVEKEILEKFTLQNILESFTLERGSHRMSLKIAIRDILEKELPINIATKNFFTLLLNTLEKESDNYLPGKNMNSMGGINDQSFQK